MAFNSLSYFIFLSVVFLLFYGTAFRYRWLTLLVSSYVFYGFLLKPSLIVILASVTIFSYYAGILIDRAGTEKSRKKLLFFSVTANLAVLVYFKYLVFLVENLNMMFAAISSGIVIPEPARMASIAFSFFIFQAISYLSDIYFRITKPEPHPGYFALYISFFPKLLQGPIERAENLLPQFRNVYEFNYDDVRRGLLLFGWGLFLKVVVADRLALFVDPVYNDVRSYSGLPLIIATYAYAFQIYFDFAGYTNMALGTARLFGVNLTQNFNSPYLATSCADFWRRWHISFSRWILDYIFIPLQMKWRILGTNGTALALFCTFLLSGIWHGASWTYIIWGILHGIFLAASTYYAPYKKKLYKLAGIEKNRWVTAWQIFITFNLVSFTYIFFRSASLEDAWFIVLNIFKVNNNYSSIQTIGIIDFMTKYIIFENKKSEIISLVFVLNIILIVYKKRHGTLFDKPLFYRWACYYCIFFIIVLLGVTSKNNFIYFQF
jgi:alginate O-acetyltransferase complex protein AlgI